MPPKIKVIIALNTSWNLFNFRAGLIRSFVAAGFEVVAVAPPDEYSPRLQALGCRFVPLHMDNKGTHPGRDMVLFCRFLQLMRKERPQVYLGYTVKPNIYGSLAAHALNIPVINNIAGLGAVFSKNSPLTLLVRTLYRLALSRSSRVFFQNPDDQSMFVSQGLVKAKISDRVPGSGIDLVRFAPVTLPNGPTLRFLLVARMLWEKGVGDFVEAARILKQRGLCIDFCLLGFLDVQNPSSISRQQMDIWIEEGIVRYLGASDNVADEIALADCIVLPSYYREGTPRILLEAAAMARPIVTTNAVGCREVVDDGINGYLCQPRDVLGLANKMAQMAALPPEMRMKMGQRGRRKVENEFDERIVIQKYLDAVSSTSRL